MPTFRKHVMGPGVHATPDGPATVTPARIKHWSDTINALVAEGYKPPVCWGHVSKAAPATDDDEVYWRARFNAGKMTSACIDPDTGWLVVESDAPGVEVDPETGALTTQAELPDGRKVRTAIEEVSIGAADWTDGKGRVWKDAPIHLALTPLPVWVPEGGQPPFEATGPLPGAQRFSTSTLLYRFATEKPPMAEEKPAEKPDEKKPKDGEGEGGGYSVKDVLEDLATFDPPIVLPDDTSDANFFERLCVALKAIKGTRGGDDEIDPPEKPAEEAAPTMLGTQRATLMSLVSQSPVVAALVKDKEDGERARRETRIAALGRRGLPAHQANALLAEASKVRFALDDKGVPAPAAVDEKLALLEDTLPKEDLSLFRQQAREVPPPEGAAPQDRYKQIADEQARNSNLPARK